jgi:predicted GNAT family acetyltransferase
VIAIEPSAIRLEGTADRGQYIYDLSDGSRAVLDFFEQPAGVITIDHTETPRAHRSQGIAGALVARAVDDFRAAGKKVIPACPFAYRKFREHPEWSDLLLRE